MVEVAQTGQVQVRRPDASELLSIRDGKYTYEEIVEWSERLHEQSQLALKTTHLPEEPDYELAAKLIINIQNDIWNTE